MGPKRNLSRRERLGLRLPARRWLLSLMVMVSAAVTKLPALRGAQEVSPPAVVMRVAGSEIQITLPDEQLKVSSQDLLEWVRSAAGAVDHYYGHFPSPILPFASELAAGTK